ncbi:unnamed protein product [Psylliodes chrysocephalus]|uniref:Uncharacterized protein n=1 Tax=Psylliodes chrysocephalus TaxID=3402493 RepID=A0A9P0D118_9CUCU|nr:unnamed protein product [Psylliodes chrysocephala]
MLSNGAGNRDNLEVRNNENPVNDNFNLVLGLIKIIIVAVCMVPLANYSLRTRTGTNQTETDQIQQLTIEKANQNSIEVLTDNIDKKNIEINPVRKKVKQEPTCSRSYMVVILEEICEELVVNNNYCTPADFGNINKHKIPKRIIKNRSKKEAKVPAIVNYAMGIILMTSVGAALLELYRAKRNPEKKDGKNSLSRKCSLADLTVMKHQRKEMVRRESIMEIPEESLFSKQLGRKLSRPPLRFD